MSKRVIVYKFGSTAGSNNEEVGSSTGFVIPVAIEQENGTVEQIDSTSFPNNGKVFISKDYEKIDSDYQSGELFALRQVVASDDFSVESRDQTRSKFWSIGQYAARLETNTYLPIIRSNVLPDIHSGLLPNFDAIDVPTNTPFFILNNETVYGPFIAQNSSNDRVITPISFATPLNLPSHHIAKINLWDLINNRLILEMNINHIQIMLITSLRYIKNSIQFEIEDYISDASLIRFFSKYNFGKDIGNFGRTEAIRLQKAIDAYSKKITQNTSSEGYERLGRIKTLLGEYLNHSDDGFEIVQNFLKSKEGSIFLEIYVSKHQSQFIGDYEQKIEAQFANRRKTLEDGINTRRAELQSAFEQSKAEFADKIEKAKQELEDIKSKSKLEQENALIDRSKEILEQIEKASIELKDTQQRLKAAKNLENIEREIDRAQARLDHINEEKEKTKKVVDAHQATLKDFRLSDEMVKIHTIQRLLSGVRTEEEVTENELSTLQPYAQQVTGETRQSYIRNLQTTLNNFNERQLSYDETANLLVTVLQNYLTIFSGPPGVGKTSTACNFASGLGLCPNESGKLNHFLSIPISRGWTSSKDFLGFYNSLRNSYQPSRTGLYQFLRALSQQKQKFLSLVLLDEANLSSIEHYWSDFLQISDTFDQNKMLDLGGLDQETRYLKLPDSLRFISTINNDSTVETLSDRLLDRAAIITLGYEQPINLESFSEEIFNGAVPYEELKNAFSYKIHEDDDIENSQAFFIINKVLKDLRSDAIKGAQINISQRKINSMFRYIQIANKLNYQQNNSIDYAISQHILPKIKGHGPQMRERLSLLIETLEQSKLPISRRLATNILESGGNFADSFSFFC